MKLLITGGCGFIGSNLASYFIKQGHRVAIFDNLYRKGVHNNLQWLRESFGSSFEFIEGDVRNYPVIRDACIGVNAIYHTAGQTAVTTSVVDPKTDFEINALGTLNVLEAARLAADNPVLIFTSTNKVYGGMEDVAVASSDTRYEYVDHPYGMDESRPLDFHSPYGCSKGSADQYVRDYARIYGLRTVVFRMSSIYGPRQFGVEDQAWVAYFVIASVMGWPLTIYGDGKQVRDILYIDDLVRAFEAATANIEITAGQIYNIGGGYTNTISIWEEFAPLLSETLKKPVKAGHFGPWRPGDQVIYVSDIRKAAREFGWHPEFSVATGLNSIVSWILQNKVLFDEFAS